MVKFVGEKKLVFLFDTSVKNMISRRDNIRSVNEKGKQNQNFYFLFFYSVDACDIKN